MSDVMVFSEKSIGVLRGLCWERFQRYHEQRADIEEAYDLADWMYKGGTARGEFDAERRKWVPRFVPFKANVGSVLFHRQVNTLAGLLGAILLSGRDLFRYEDKPIPGVENAEETGLVTARAMNALANQFMRLDAFNQKLPEFCVNVFKWSNIFAQISIRREYRETLHAETEYTIENGVPIPKKKLRRSRRELIVYPTVTFHYPRNVYADKFIPNMADQEVVVILSTTTKHRLISEAKWFDKAALAKIDVKKMAWNGMYGGDGRDSEQEHLGRNTGYYGSGLLLRWDCYAWVPVKDGEITEHDPEKDEEPPEMKLVWAVFVGNTLEDAVCLRCVDDFDPDGEIPIKEIRATPDNSDMLYHTFLSEIIRAPYAADSSLMNAALDLSALMTNPPLKVMDPPAHRVKDFSFRPGQVWPVTRQDAIQEFQVRDISQQLIWLREQVRQESRLALATDSSKLGEYAGSRTTATEVLRVTSTTDVTVALRNAYIVGQFLPWLARKYISYAREFVPSEVIQRLVHEQIPDAIVGNYVGEYDVVVDIIGQYEDDMMARMGLDRMMQILANPAFMQSPTHRINVGRLVRLYLEKHNLPAAAIIEDGGASEAENNARNRITLMLHTGVYEPPKEGEDYEAHMRVATAERLRWRGLEDSPDPRSKNVKLIDQYMEDLKVVQQLENQRVMAQISSMIRQQGAGQEGLGGGGVQMPGNVVGNEIAGEFGAAFGG